MGNYNNKLDCGGEDNRYFPQIDIEDLTQVVISYEKVQIGTDQEKAQSEKDFHANNRDRKKLN